MKSIIEIQNKADAIFDEIEKLELLIAENTPDDANIETVLTQLNDQRNELLIAEKMGADNKTQIAEIDKTIKATKAAEAKAKEQRDFIRAIQKKIEAKSDEIAKLAKEHQRQLIDYLKGLVHEKQKEREQAFNKTLQIASDIDALDFIARYKAGYGRDLCSETFLNMSFLTALNRGGAVTSHELQTMRNTQMGGFIEKLEREGLRIRIV